MQSKPPTWQSRAAEVFAWGAALLAWAVCLTSEIELAWKHGFADLLGLLWALGLDMTALSCMFLALDGAKRGRRTGEVWTIAGGATIAMIAANVLVAGPDVVGAVMHGASPVLAVALWHALVHGRRAHESAGVSLVESRPAKRPGGMKRALYAIPFVGKHVSRDWTLGEPEARASLDEPSAPQDALPEHAPSVLPAPRERRATGRGATSKRDDARRLLAARSWDASTRAEVIKEVARKTGADVTSVRRVVGEIEKARAPE